MQGDPLEMIAYIIGILPPIKTFKHDLPGVTQLCYEDIAGALSMFSIINTYFNLLTYQGPWRRYHPIPPKIILIVHPENIETRKVFSARHGFKVCTGERYLGGYNKDDKSTHDWLRERMLMLENNIGTISKTTGKYSQDSYATVACTIQ